MAVDAFAYAFDVDGGSVLDVDALLLGRCFLHHRVCNMAAGFAMGVAAFRLVT